MDTTSVIVDLDRSGRHLTVYVAGELDAATAPPFADEVIRQLRPNDQVVWLDLTAVTFCGSCGIAAFIRVHHAIDEAGGRLTLYNPTPGLERVLTLCGVDRIMSIWTTSEARPSPLPA